MTAFGYRNRELYAEDVALRDIAERAGTPVYVYSTAALESAYSDFITAFAGQPVEVCYAMKANDNLAVVRTLAAQGAGADVVSGGELQRAQAAGLPGDRIVFSGVGKSTDEMRLGVSSAIKQFNVESIPELHQLSAVATELDRTVDIAIRINPDVYDKTHAKITTGTKQNKFGIDLADAHAAFTLAASLPGLNPVAIAVHIGSQLTSLEPYREAFTRVAAFCAELRADGFAIGRLDLGGGLGITYRDEVAPSLPDYAAIVRDTVGHLGCELTLEPGRRIAGPAGVLLSRVLFVKQTPARRFVILDAAMNDLSRPAMYDAWHNIRPIEDPAGATVSPADVVGPVCESSDTFAQDRPLPSVDAGNLIAIDNAGAYGAVMASTYNARPLVAEVLVHGSDFAIVRPRQTVEDLLALDVVPDWLGAAPHGT